MLNNYDICTSGLLELKISSKNPLLEFTADLYLIRN